MRLAAFVPSIPGNLVASLERCGIRTDADLLFSAPVFEIFQRLPAGTVTLRDLARYVDTVAEKLSAPGISAPKFLELELQAQANAPDLLTGLPELDELLGGFGGRRVIEISGDKRSGKSTLALHLVLRHLAHHGQSSIIWMDTTGDFSADRANQILISYDTQAASTALERLQVSLAFDVDSVHRVLDALRSSLNSDATGLKVDCIVVDAITPLLGPLLSAVSAQGHAIMDGMMRELRALAQRHSLPVLVN
ncbi:P-loop containing nucleoside triphosphate hydrolase protein [Tricholoma matsutake]|nr:P-loop containing nucleoside triphosphate hydrolase protein [Tricholoma matsutake 945]